MKKITIIIILTVISVMSVASLIVANPVHPAAKVKILNMIYDEEIDGMVVLVEGHIEQQPVILMKDFTTEAEFMALLVVRVNDMIDRIENPPLVVEPTLPTTKINEAMKLIGKEIAL